MRGIALTSPTRLEMQSFDMPVLRGEYDVLLRILRVGICGSDIHYYKTGRIGSQIARFPQILGHECSARVAAVGRKVSRVKVGDLVVIDPAISCDECDQCRAGCFHICRNIRFLGVPDQMPGAMLEYLVLPQKCCYPVDWTFGADRAVLVEPLSIGYYATHVVGNLTGKEVAILGAGPIGLSVMLMAKLYSPKKVLVSDLLSDRLRVAHQIGATWTGFPDELDKAYEIQAIAANGLDVIFECCGEQIALDQAVRLLKPGGTLVIIGIPESDRVSFAIHELRRKEIRLINVRRQNECIMPVIELLKNGQVKADFLISHRFEVNDFQTAFDTVANYRDGVIKALVKIE